MKKTKIQIVISYSINIILIGFILLSNKGFILNNDKIILKNMSETTQVSDLNKSINELEASHEEYQNYIQTKKTDLATAMTNAGVKTSGEDTFETMIGNVSKILSNSTNDATAVESEILTGKIAYVKGSKIIGTMPNRGELNWNPSSSTSYTVPEGYYSGGTISTSNAYQAGYNNGGTKGSLEGWSWSVASGKSFTAPYNCYAIAFAYAGTHNASGDKCSSSASISSTGTNVYVPIPSHTNTSTSSSSAFVGPLSRATGIYKLSQGQTITMSCSGYQGGSGVIMYAPI